MSCLTRRSDHDAANIAAQVKRQAVGEKERMKEPSAYEKVHWKLFNAFARLFGSLLILACVAFAILTVKSLKVPGNLYPPWLLLVFLPLIALGVMMIKVNPYYPNE